MSAPRGGRTKNGMWSSARRRAARARRRRSGVPAGTVEAKVGSQPAVVELVVVEVDRAVLLGGVPPVVLAAVPVPARHGADRAVHAVAVQPVRPGVAHDVVDTVLAVAGGRVPAGDEPSAGGSPPAAIRRSRRRTAPRPCTPQRSILRL